MKALADDLFTPTLAPDYDVSRFRRPWWPWSIVVVCFFGTFIAGGVLFAINFARMRRYRALLWTMMGTLVFTLVILALALWVGKHKVLAGQAQIPITAASTAIGILLARGQRRDVKVYCSYSGRGPARVWFWGVLAVLGYWYGMIWLLPRPEVSD